MQAALLPLPLPFEDYICGGNNDEGSNNEDGDDNTNADGRKRDDGPIEKLQCSYKRCNNQSVTKKQLPCTADKSYHLLTSLLVQ